jgi:1-hydroxycarotenoid 3,4-desaturase
MTPNAHVIVVGGGVGGLVAAALLSHQGVRVTLLERAAALGGKLRQAEVDRQAIDVGPTVFTLRPLFEAVFDACGESLAALLPLRPLPLLARHAWADGATLDLPADLDAPRRTPSAPSPGSAAADRLPRLRAEKRAPHPRRAGRRPTCAPAGRCRGRWWAAPGCAACRACCRSRRSPGCGTSSSAGSKHPRLQQLFGRYATYCGSSPFEAPATLMLVAHAERLGVWSVDGGMHRVAQALAGIARARGAELRCSAPVARLLVAWRPRARRQAGGWRTAGGRRRDLQRRYRGAGAGPARRRAQPHGATHVARTSGRCRPSPGPAWRARAASRSTAMASSSATTTPPNSATCAQGRLPAAPTIYLCTQDRGAGARRRAAGERVFVPGQRPGQRRPARPAARGDRGMRENDLRPPGPLRLQISWSPQGPQRTTPADFQARYPGTGGALYGRATHGWRASFQRPGSSSRMPGLYLAGGSAHPGPGLPMAATSGLLAAQAVLAALASRTSTFGWRATATPGGTSTR